MVVPKIAVPSPYIAISNVAIYNPIETPTFFPSFNRPPNNPAKASKLICEKLATLDRLKMRPVTTPTVEPTVAPATKANNNHKITGKDMVNR